MHSLIQTLLTDKVDVSHACKVQPLGVMKNSAFMIDLDEVQFEDLKADDLGSKRIYFRFTQSQSIRYASGKPCGSVVNEYFVFILDALRLIT